MDQNITISVISSAGAVIVGLAAIGSNTFWINRALQGIEHRLDVIETDLKQFFQLQNQHDKDIQRLKDKTGLP